MTSMPLVLHAPAQVAIEVGELTSDNWMAHDAAWFDNQVYETVTALLPKLTHEQRSEIIRNNGRHPAYHATMEALYERKATAANPVTAGLIIAIYEAIEG